MKKALITGASSGIGLELAKIMAEKGHDLVLVSRDEKELKKIKKLLTSKHGIEAFVVATDLSKPGSAKELYRQLKSQKIGILVNNAGAGLKGNFFTDDLAKNQSIAYLNMNSLMDLTYYFGKDFIAKGEGKILNTASIVSFFPGPNQPVYYATKAFVRSFSRALAQSTKGTGVTVTALHPGATRTNFFKSANAGFFKAGASPHSVAKLGYEAMMAGKIEVVHGIKNKILTHVFARFIPYNLQAKIVEKSSEV